MGNIFIMGIWQKQSRKKSWEHHVESMIPMLNSWFPWLSHDFPIEQTKQILRWIGFSTEKKNPNRGFSIEIFFPWNRWLLLLHLFFPSKQSIFFVFMGHEWEDHGNDGSWSWENPSEKKSMGTSMGKFIGVDHGKIHGKIMARYHGIWWDLMDIFRGIFMGLNGKMYWMLMDHERGKRDMNGILIFGAMKRYHFYKLCHYVHCLSPD